LPAPFNPITTIRYHIPELNLVTLKNYDVLGGEIATLVNTEKPTGSYEIEFNAASLPSEIVTLVNSEKPIGNYEVEFNATALPSGIYFYRLQAGEFIETKKMVLMK